MSYSGWPIPFRSDPESMSMLCEASDIIPGETQCRRQAQWNWVAQDVRLCHFHAEPLLPECNPDNPTMLERL